MVVVEAPIGRDMRSRTRMAVVAGGKPARTDVRQWPRDEPFDWGEVSISTDTAAGPRWSDHTEQSSLTRVECTLHTGRTHQIRAHMKYAGHTLFADSAYGGDKILKGPQTGLFRQFVQGCLEACPRQALHAATLGFEHPSTGKNVFFEAPLPLDFRELLARWQRFESR
jgi:23S rRNA-/tRNA-specific pseudouridylate synthase